jgi:hypothetical protein
VPLSQLDVSAVPVQVRSCPQLPGPDVVPEPHLLLVQLCPAGQVPQLRVPPQPSEMMPHVAPCAEQVVGVHVPPGHAATGLSAGVGQSLYENPALRVNVAANCAQPLSQVLLQQYACAELAQTSWTHQPLAFPDAGMQPPDEVVPP